LQFKIDNIEIITFEDRNNQTGNYPLYGSFDDIINILPTGWIETNFLEDIKEYLKNKFDIEDIEVISFED